MKAKRPPTRAKTPAGAIAAAALAPGMYVATPVAEEPVAEAPAVMTAAPVMEADADIIPEPDADIMEEEAAAALEVMFMLSAGIGMTAGAALPQSPIGARGHVTFWQIEL